MLTLHHLINSRSQRIIWLLEELGVNYGIVIHGRDPKNNTALDTLKKIHPLGKAPVLCDGETVIAESTAIIDYLLENYSEGQLEPQRKTAERIQYLYWRHFAEGTLMPYLAMKQLFARMKQLAPYFAKPVIQVISRAVNQRYLNPNIHAALAEIESHLQMHRWFAGDQLTAADIIIVYMLQALHSQFTPVQYPHIRRVIDTMYQRPAFQRAQEKGQWNATTHKQYWQCLALTS